jgi:outer membrane protein TolC
MKTVLKMKKTMSKRFLIIFFLAGCTFFTGWGQHLPDSLASYLEIAAINNHGVRQKLYEYQAALQKVPQAGSLPDPVLTAGVLLKPMELVNGTQIADLKLMQMFPWFGFLRSAKDEMSLMANAKFEIFRDTKLQVYYDVSSSWYELFKVRKSTDISEKNLAILKTIEHLAAIRFQSAVVAGSELADVYRIQMEEGELQNKIALLKDKDYSITARFNGYLDRLPETPVYTTDSLIVDTLAVSLSEISGSILKNNPMLTMLELEKQSYEARAEMVRRMSYPMIGLGLDYSVMGKKEASSSSMNGVDMIMPMVSVTLPLYRKKYDAMVKEADLLRKAVSDNYTDSENSLQAELYQTVQYYRDARRKYDLYSDQYRLASKTLDIIIKSYAASSASLTDLLRIRQQAYDYELEKAEALTDVNTATARLRRLMAL